MIVNDLAEALYHAHSALSSTQARWFADVKQGKKSLAHVKHLLDNPRPGTTTFDVGTAAHTLILGTGRNTIEYPTEHLTPSGAISTKAATVAWAEEQRANGLVPVSPNDAKAIRAMAESVLAHDEARAILEANEGREVSIFADTPEGVEIRARFDIHGQIGADLKTTQDASPEGFAKAVATYRYDIQAAHYMDAHWHSESTQLDAFKFIAVEKTAPYVVAVHQLPEYWLSIGRDYARQARETLAHCRQTNHWPGYEGTNTLDAPGWLTNQHEDDFEQNEIRI